MRAHWLWISIALNACGGGGANDLAAIGQPGDAAPFAGDAAPSLVGDLGGVRCSGDATNGQPCGTGKDCQEGACAVCEPVGGACDVFWECCNNSCDLDKKTCTCGGSGVFCAQAVDCCSGLCDPSTGGCACSPLGGMCSITPDCCQGGCVAGTCVCGAVGQYCIDAGGCCSGICGTSHQCQCSPSGGVCKTVADCCINQPCVPDAVGSGKHCT